MRSQHRRSARRTEEPAVRGRRYGAAVITTLASSFLPVSDTAAAAAAAWYQAHLGFDVVDR